MDQTYSGALVRFIQEHPSVYHVIEGQRQQLLAAGYEPLLESRPCSCARAGGTSLPGTALPSSPSASRRGTSGAL